MKRALFRQVNHITVAASNAEALFGFFADSLQFPTAWPFAEFGWFASGGVSVGDCAIEVLRVPGALPRALVRGVALEPVDGPGLLPALDSRGFSHGQPMSTPGADGSPMWTNVRLNSGDDRTPTIFSCDYHFIDVPVELANGRAELARRDGGPLGVTGCAQLLLSASQRQMDEAQWAALLSPMPVLDGMARFASGPDVSLANRDVESITLRVRSLERAVATLAALGLSSERADAGARLLGEPLQGLELHLNER